MARGTVKDPAGHQSKEYGFGYIQRTEGFSEEEGKIYSTLWDDDLKPKVIPFNNTGRSYQFNQLVSFKVVEAHVVMLDSLSEDLKKQILGAEGYLGTIGIAEIKK